MRLHIYVFLVSLRVKQQLDAANGAIVEELLHLLALEDTTASSDIRERLMRLLLYLNPMYKRLYTHYSVHIHMHIPCTYSLYTHSSKYSGQPNQRRAISLNRPPDWLQQKGPPAISSGQLSGAKVPLSRPSLVICGPARSFLLLFVIWRVTWACMSPL